MIPNSLIAQGKFRIELSAPSLINEHVLFSPESIAKGFEDIYCISVDTNRNTIDFGKKFGFEKCSYNIAVQERNIIQGEFDYPIPFTFQYLDAKEGQVYFSTTFFLDSGSYKVEYKKMAQLYSISLNSPVNNEYASFKTLFADLYVKVEDKLKDSLINLNEKERRVGSYIKKNPDSYVALWEIFDDYVNHDYYPVYLENLQLFSDKMKRSKLFIKFENRLKLDSASHKKNRYEVTKTVVAGSSFPEIKFDEHNTLTKEDFEKHKLTFIDCWATWCGPCRKAIPEVVALYNEYNKKGVNFITVTLERKQDKIKEANEFLKKNNVEWQNYFDINNDFNDKVSALAIPLLFIVDQNGKIVMRMEGADIESIKKIFDDYLKL
jgi:thiol-disulfide isomerase/thioredoxin